MIVEPMFFEPEDERHSDKEHYKQARTESRAEPGQSCRSPWITDRAAATPPGLSLPANWPRAAAD